MKFALLSASALLIFSSCAPKAFVIIEGEQLSKPNTQAVAQSAPTPAPVTENLPNFKPDDGLLDPSGLTAMPANRDMKPTVEEKKTAPVIANPPKEEKPTSE